MRDRIKTARNMHHTHTRKRTITIIRNLRKGSHKRRRAFASPHTRERGASSYVYCHSYSTFIISSIHFKFINLYGYIQIVLTPTINAQTDHDGHHHDHSHRHESRHSSKVSSVGMALKGDVDYDILLDWFEQLTLRKDLKCIE